MNDISKIELASFVLNEVKKNSLKDLLCSFYGATEVNYRDTTYGICIDIVGSCNFRFIKVLKCNLVLKFSKCKSVKS